MSGVVAFMNPDSGLEEFIVDDPKVLADHLLEILDESFARMQSLDVQGQYVKMDAAADVLLDLRQHIHKFSSRN